MCIIPKGSCKCFLLAGLIPSLLLALGGLYYFLYLNNEKSDGRSIYGIIWTFSVVWLLIFIFGYFRGYNACNRIERGIQRGNDLNNYVNCLQKESRVNKNGGIIYVGEEDYLREKLQNNIIKDMKDERSGKLDVS